MSPAVLPGGRKFAQCIHSGLYRGEPAGPSEATGRGGAACYPPADARPDHAADLAVLALFIGQLALVAPAGIELGSTRARTELDSTPAGYELDSTRARTELDSTPAGYELDITPACTELDITSAGDKLDGTPPCTPEIATVGPFEANATQTVEISGSCLGTGNTTSGTDTAYFRITDLTTGWNACWTGDPGTTLSRAISRPGLTTRSPSVAIPVTTVWRLGCHQR